MSRFYAVLEVNGVEQGLYVEALDFDEAERNAKATVRAVDSVAVRFVQCLSEVSQ
jgi:hypothetical protein